jgi:hypothetical protein
MASHRRLPISARHAFALALDLAVRRDAVQSLLVPFLLHTPWVVAQALLPGPDEPGGMTARNLSLNSAVLLGDFLMSLLVAAMLRFRARSVFNTPPGTPAAGALQCYRRALGRLPWLFVTELLRNVAMFGAGLFLVLPGVWVGFRFSMATEAAVLRDTTAFGAFRRSYRLAAGRLERWLEMIVISVVVVLTVLFACVTGFFAMPHTSWSTWATVALCVLPLVMSVIQYAWTFFYLRMEEIDVPLVVGSIPPAGSRGGGEGAVAGTTPQPRLKLVEGRAPSEPPGRH